MTTRLSVLPAPDTTRRHALAINQLTKNCEPFLYSDGVQTVSASIDLATGYTFKINAVQVVGPRETGWTADTGTASKAAQATYAAGATLTFTDPPSAAEMSALATRIAAIETALQATTQGKKALKDALITHGLIGA